MAVIKPTVQTEVKLDVRNTRSVGNKLDYVLNPIFDKNLGMVVLTETWLSNGVGNTLYLKNLALIRWTIMTVK